VKYIFIGVLMNQITFAVTIGFFSIFINNLLYSFGLGLPEEFKRNHNIHHQD